MPNNNNNNNNNNEWSSSSPSEDTPVVDFHCPDIDKNGTHWHPPLDSVSMKLKNTYYRTMYHSLSPTCAEELCQQNATNFKLVFNEVFTNAEVEYAIKSFTSSPRSAKHQYITAYFNICHR